MAITIETHHILKNQTWNPNTGLNIITSKNGGGKTSLLQYIFSKNENISNRFFDSVDRFECKTDLALYMYTNPHNLNDFGQVYLILYSLRDSDESKVVECNEFFQELGLHIRIDNWTRNSGRIRFANHTGNFIAFNQISTGEKTAFILWLIMQSNPKPKILLLDEFDSAMDEDIVSNFYKHLITISEQGIQIFIATHRRKSLVLDEQNIRNNSDGTSKYTRWRITDGIIKEDINYNK